MQKTALYYTLMTLFLMPLIALHIDIPQAYYGVMLFILWLPSATTIAIMETHYRRTGASAAIVASSTLVSLLFLTLGVWGSMPCKHCFSLANGCSLGRLSIRPFRKV